MNMLLLRFHTTEALATHLPIKKPLLQLSTFLLENRACIRI